MAQESHSMTCVSDEMNMVIIVPTGTVKHRKATIVGGLELLWPETLGPWSSSSSSLAEQSSSSTFLGDPHVKDPRHPRGRAIRRGLDGAVYRGAPATSSASLFLQP